MAIARRMTYNSQMGRAGIRVLMIAVIATCLACPILQAFDHWDHAEAKGKDTESTFMVVAIAVGLAIPVASVVFQSTGATEAFVEPAGFVFIWNQRVIANVPIPVSQPPPILRI
jgi:hypothetical protein